ncbi:Cyanovirin-N [Aspergillus varians]
MSFHESAQNIRIEDGHRLFADLRNEDGDFVEAEFDLNQILGNNDGHFEWDANDFSSSAEDIELHIEGDDNVPVLRAVLGNSEGETVEANVNLAERLGNDNGSFQFI